MDEIVRPAALSDAAMIAGFEATARALLVEQRGGPQWLEGEPQWSELDVARRAAASSWHILVCEIDDVPVGFGAAQLVGAICKVERLFVEPEARQLGLGEMMLESLTLWARVVGAATIESIALPGDRETKNLFERFGMKARLLVVSRDLADATEEDAS
jgi:GNAT superfamily N-acetyltransferase